MALFRWINRGAWALALLFVFQILPHIAHQNGGSDFTRMWCCSIAARTTDLGNLYSPKGNRQMVAVVNAYKKEHYPSAGAAGGFYLPWDQTSFTPALLTAFALVQGTNLHYDCWLFHRVSKIMFGLGFLALAAMLGVPGVIAFPLLWLVATTSSSFIWVQRWCNMECVQMSALALTMCLLRGRKPVLLAIVGLNLSLIAAFKPTALMAPVLLGLSFLAMRRWKLLGSLAAGAAVGVFLAGVLPTLVLGNDVTWHEWLGYTRSIVNTNAQDKSAFLAEILYHLDLPHAPDRLGVLFGSMVSLSIVAFWTWASSRELTSVDPFPTDAAAVAAGAMMFIVSGPYVFGRYFLLAIPAAIVTLRLKPPSLVAGRVWMAASTLAIYLIGNPAWTDAHDSYPAFSAFGGVIILFGLLFAGRYWSTRFDQPARF